MTRETTRPGRGWAMAVLVLAGLISVSFNVFHAFTATALPWPLALLYGFGPVTLAAMLSHVVAVQAAGREPVGRFRKVMTFALVLGGLALSYMATLDVLAHAVPDPISATAVNEPAVTFPIVVDLMALMALNELLRVGPAAVAETTETVPVAPATSPALAAPAAAPTDMVRAAVPEERALNAPEPLPAVLAADVESVLAADTFAADFRAGNVPSIRRIREHLSSGQERAKRAHEYVTALAA